MYLHISKPIFSALPDLQKVVLPAPCMRAKERHLLLYIQRQEVGWTSSHLLAVKQWNNNNNTGIWFSPGWQEQKSDIESWRWVKRLPTHSWFLQRQNAMYPFLISSSTKTTFLDHYNMPSEWEGLRISCRKLWPYSFLQQCLRGTSMGLRNSWI